MVYYSSFDFQKPAKQSEQIDFEDFFHCGNSLQGFSKIRLLKFSLSLLE